MLKKYLFFLLVLLSGCVSQGAIKTELAAVKNNLNKLERIVDNKVDTTIMADTIDHFKQEINQSLLNMNKTINNSGTIKYGGGGWIVTGTSVVVLIFVGAGLLLIKAFMRRGSLLTMLTRAVKMAGEDFPNTIIAIKKQLKCSVKDGHFSEQDRKNLGNFARKRGTFVE